MLLSKRESYPALKQTINIFRAAACVPQKWLAQSVAASQYRSGMSSSARPYSSARVVVAAVLFTAFSWTLLGSVSPQFHARIHADASHLEHVCAITLIASGSYEQTDQPALVGEPQFNVRSFAGAEISSTWVKSLFLNAHIFAHAPPAHS